MSHDDDFDDYDDDGDDDITHLYLTFGVGDTNYGVPVAHVTEIVSLGRLVTMPDLPPYLRGVINLRGTVMPVVDMRVRLGLEPIDISRRTPAIILEREGEFTALLVDGVREVTQLLPEIIDEPPKVPARDGAGKLPPLVRAVARSKDLITVIVEPAHVVGQGHGNIPGGVLDAPIKEQASA